MTIGSVLFMIGAGLQAGAIHLGMLIAGRIMLGKPRLPFGHSDRCILRLHMDALACDDAQWTQ